MGIDLSIWQQCPHKSGVNARLSINLNYHTIYYYYIFMMMQLSIHSIALLIDRHHKPCILYYHKLQTVLITIFNSHFSLITNTIQLSRRDVEELDFIQGYYVIESIQGVLYREPSLTSSHKPTCFRDFGGENIQIPVKTTRLWY